MLKSTVGINDYEELVPQHEPYSCLIYIVTKFIILQLFYIG